MNRLTAPLIAVAVAGAVLVPGAGLAARASSRPAPPTVPCDQIVLRSDPNAASDGEDRILLGVIWVADSYYAQAAAATHDRKWPYFRKAGLDIRGGIRLPVTVIVPKAWRSRVAIKWGYSGVVSTIRFAPCPSWGPMKWNGYAGGFYLRARSACVPLIFHVGDRRATVRFGIGRRCGS